MSPPGYSCFSQRVVSGQTRGEEGRIDGIYEADIALTTWQASQIVQDLSKRPKRKLAEPLAKRWALPIPYIFDGTHSEYDILCKICNICNMATGSRIIQYDR